MDEINERFNEIIRQLQAAHEEMESDQHLRDWIKWRTEAGLSATVDDWIEHCEHSRRFDILV